MDIQPPKIDPIWSKNSLANMFAPLWPEFFFLMIRYIYRKISGLCNGIKMFF